MKVGVLNNDIDHDIAIQIVSALKKAGIQGFTLRELEKMGRIIRELDIVIERAKPERTSCQEIVLVGHSLSLIGKQYEEMKHVIVQKESLTLPCWEQWSRNDYSLSKHHKTNIKQFNTR